MKNHRTHADDLMETEFSGLHELVVPQKPSRGWLETVRRALDISQQEAAAKARVSQQAFDQFESGEIKGTISLDRLQRAAAALNCEFVYFLRPRRPMTGNAVDELPMNLR